MPQEKAFNHFISAITTNSFEPIATGLWVRRKIYRVVKSVNIFHPVGMAPGIHVERDARRLNTGARPEMDLSGPCRSMIGNGCCALKITLRQYPFQTSAGGLQSRQGIDGAYFGGE